MQNKAIIAEILASPDVKLFIEDHRNDELVALALRYTNKDLPFPLPPVLELLDVIQRGQNKLPEILKTGWLFTKRAYEQCSSELTADWKALQISGNELLNLSGGIGVDDRAFAKVFKHITSLDLDETVHHLAEYNMRSSGITNVERRCADAEQFDLPMGLDCIYIDPDRRQGAQRKVGLEEATPDVVRSWNKYLDHAKDVMLKASPLLDVTQALRELSHIREVQAVAVNGEVKELLFIAGRDAVEAKYTAVELTDSTCVFSGQPGLAEEQMDHTEEPYFLEVHGAISKLNLQADYGQQIEAMALNQPGTYRILNVVPSDRLMGRVFSILHADDFKPKAFKKYLNSLKLSKANLNKRDFPLSVAKLRKTLKLGDGGDDYFFFYRNTKKQPCFIHARKLHPSQ